MNYEYDEIVNVLRNEIKNRANEISYRLSESDVSQIHELLLLIDELEGKMGDFDDIVDCAWEERAIF